MESNSQMEIWKIIPGFSGYYEASNHGRIRSVDRLVNGFSHRGARPVQLKRKQKILSLNSRRMGYLFVNLCCDGAMRKEQVHKLVLMAFIGDRPDGMFGCHNDGDSTNNHISNLRWDTPKNNQSDRIKHKTDRRGEQVGTSKITFESAKAIKTGMKVSEAIKNLGISRSQFYRIKNGESWCHV